MKQKIADELIARAEKHIPASHLIVNYYRIYRRIAYKIPVRAFHCPEYDDRKGYPWSIWLTWDLEERIQALGWNFELFQNADAKRLAVQDIICTGYNGSRPVADRQGA